MSPSKDFKDIPEGDITSNNDAAVDNFDHMDLKPELLRGIYAYGFEKPSVLQAHTIVPIIKKRDVIAQAQPGSGKTSALAIAILQRINPEIGTTQALIMVPTSELAHQTDKAVIALNDQLNVQSMFCIGSTAVRLEVDRIRSSQILIGTPRHFHDLLIRGAIKSDNIATVCLDDADEMSFRGYNENIRDILKEFLPATQVIVLTDSMPNELVEIVAAFTKEPVRILQKQDAESS